METRPCLQQFAVRLILVCGILNFAFKAAAEPSKEGALPPHEVTTILFLGDSLTDGYGVKKEEAYPEIVGRILNASKHRVTIVNGSISGSVTADADRRLKWLLKAKPDVLVLALGSNDALKGTAPRVIEKNLEQVIDLAKENKLRVLLCGVQVFTNFGSDYNQKLAESFRELARRKKVALLPFLLEDVALKKGLNQADGKHPNAKGHEVIARRVAAELEKLL